MRFEDIAKLSFGALCVLVSSALCSTVHAQAQPYPVRPITLVVPTPPGNSTDIVGRTAAQQASIALGVPFVIENRPGASTLLASSWVARAPADGYTLLLISSAMTGALALGRVPQISLDQLAPITTIANAPLALLVRSTAPSGSVAEFVSYAKSAPDKVNLGTNGVGTSSHLTAVKFSMDAGFPVTDIPYPGIGQVIQELMAGRVDMTFDTLTSALGHVKSGRVKLMAVTSKERSAASPETPTLRELGYPDVVYTPWWGIAAPAGTPETILRQLEKAFVDAGQNVQVRERLIAAGTNPLFSPRSEATATMKDDLAYWTTIIRKAGIKVQ